MPQASALYSDLTARENVRFFASMSGLAQAVERVDEVLRLVGLAARADDLVSTFSGGMRRRASLASALVHQPALLLLDEPTVGLDPLVRASFWGYFRELAAAGTTLVISSHSLDEASNCDQLAFLRHGRVIAQGSPGALLAAAQAGHMEEAFITFARRPGSQP
jgi:ABC-2 type transport system ATP-binding protein